SSLAQVRHGGYGGPSGGRPTERKPVMPHRTRARLILGTLLAAGLLGGGAVAATAAAPAAPPKPLAEKCPEGDQQANRPDTLYQEVVEVQGDAVVVTMSPAVEVEPGTCVKPTHDT